MGRMVELLERYRRFRRFAIEHFPRNSPTKQDLEGHPKELGKKSHRTLQRNQRRQRKLRQILRTVRKEHQTRNPRRLQPEEEARRVPSILLFFVRKRVRRLERLRFPNEGQPERYLLYHWRVQGRRQELCLR